MPIQERELGTDPQTHKNRVGQTEVGVIRQEHNGNRHKMSCAVGKR